MAECDPTSFPAQCFQTRGGRLHEDDGSWGYLTYDLRVRMRLKERLDAYERGLIVAALNEASGNRTHAARALGLNRGTLHSKLHKYGLAAADDEEDEPAAHP